MNSPTEVETFCWDSFLERDKIYVDICEFSGWFLTDFGSSTKKNPIFLPKKGLEKPSQKHRIPRLRPPVPPPPPEAPPVPPTPPSDLPALPEIPPLTPEVANLVEGEAGISGCHSSKDDLIAGLMKGNHPFPDLSHLIIFPHLCFLSSTCL